MDFGGYNKENVRRSCRCSNTRSNSDSTNKANIIPTRKPTGAIQKTNQPQRSSNCSYNLRSSRQPLGDLNQNQNQQTKVRKHVQFNDVNQPEPLSRTRQFVQRNSTYVNERATAISSNASSTLLDFTASSTDATWGQTGYGSTPPDNFAISNDDNTFWTTFLVELHKNTPKFRAVRKVNETKNLKHNQSIIHDSIPSLKKKTLKKQCSKSSGYLGIVNLDPYQNTVEPAILYSLEYMNDIVYSIIIKQEMNIMRPELLNKDNSFLDKRASVINWLVKLNQYLVSDAEIFFMSVRLFDKILTLVDIPESNYQLTAIAAYWISAKYIKSSNLITARQLLKLCNYVFAAKCLIEMEKTIYLILQFDIVVDEPVFFVYYYIYILQLYDSNMMAFSAIYLLELLTLDFNCNTFPLSLQAASAVFLSLKMFNIEERVWKGTEKYFGYHDKIEMFEVQKIMIKNIMLTNDEECPYKESFTKYSTEKYGKVSLLIQQILSRWYNAVNDITLLVL